MALIPSFMRRPTAILKMPDAIARGLTATGFLRELKGLDLGYRKTLFLSDWRGVASIEAKKDRIKYIRKDRVPSPRVLPDVPWQYSKEYIYKLNTFSRISPDKPVVERMVTFQSDEPMTMAQVEAAVFEKWTEWERYKEQLERVEPEAAYHRLPFEFEEED